VDWTFDGPWAAGAVPPLVHGGYLVPLKVAVRRAEGVDEGDVVSLRLVVGA
jgi:hypothetical protein